MTKQDTLKKLKEESSNLYYAMTVFRALYLIYVGMNVLVMIAVTIFHNNLTVLLQSGSSKAHYISLLMKFFSPFPYLLDDKSPHLLFYLIGGILTAAGASLCALVFHIVVRVFKTVQDGASPFTQKNSDAWKTLYKIYAVLAVLSFLSCFIFGIAGLLILVSMLIYCCFFLFLSLIFQYGSDLQQESDETL